MAGQLDKPIDVFDYVDYRAFLRDFYARAKARQRGFSHRAFSRRAGLASPNHLKRVMDGDRNLTLETASRFAEALSLEGEAADYFLQLVRLDQAKGNVERSAAFDKLATFKAYRRTRKLDLAHSAYHATWYVPVVRELAGRADFRAQPKWIAERTLPPIKPAEAQAALDILLDLGLLTRDGKGKIKQSEPLLSTGPEMPALHIARYHRMMMQKAAESIDLVPSHRRDISSVVLLLSESGIARIKRRIQRLRRELLELSLAEKNATQVVQMNFQIFPMSVAPDEEPKP